MYELLKQIKVNLQTTPRYLYSFRAFCIGLLVFGLLFALSRDPLPFMEGIQMGDKILHASAFFIFAALFHLAWSRSFWLYVFLPLLAYGGLIEILQGMTTWRSMSWGDVVADAVGILLYYAVYKLISTRSPKPLANT
ncbi:MAG: VanZ family protein [Thiofilum sp.]|uniref:VanZ family protein n=1 Tax=Thiofilum sp. TaxID=2212733 RepID=UPI0025F2293F|nr:VanZ family protein [Thiofilum sp.]MBK8452819.1 VanZ family protein [Thiofilum sp.]